MEVDFIIKLLIGGSSCQYWSIARKNNRETIPTGLGWELFKNYLIAKHKFQPDYFLYENNKSASQAIKQEISKALNVKLQYINSALVSAQSRYRFYAHNIPNVMQPDDRGIHLKDILLDNQFDFCNVGNAPIIQKVLPKLQSKYGYIPDMFNPYNLAKITDKSPTLTSGSMLTSSCATCKFELYPMPQCQNMLLKTVFYIYTIADTQQN